MSEIAFTVLGRPQQKGSKSALLPRGAKFAVAVEQNRRAAPWEATIRAQAHDARLASGEELLLGPVAVDLIFLFGRPKGHYGTGRNAGTVRSSAPAHMIVMPDIDKLARCALDALSGVVFRDDAQVCALKLRKSYGEPDRLEARVIDLAQRERPLPFSG